MEKVTFRLREDLLEYVEKLAEKRNITRSAAIRDIIGVHRGLMESYLDLPELEEE